MVGTGARWNLLARDGARAEARMLYQVQNQEDRPEMASKPDRGGLPNVGHPSKASRNAEDRLR